LRKLLGDGEGGERYVANISGRGYSFGGRAGAGSGRGLPRTVSLASSPVRTHGRARRGSPAGFRGGHAQESTEAQAPAVVHICRRLNEIALGIKVMASRVGAYGIQGIAELFDRRFELQWQGCAGAAVRHQTLQGMLDWQGHPFLVLGGLNRRT
jgi:hypothetical protein